MTCFTGPHVLLQGPLACLRACLLACGAPSGLVGAHDLLLGPVKGAMALAVGLRPAITHLELWGPPRMFGPLRSQKLQGRGTRPLRPSLGYVPGSRGHQRSKRLFIGKMGNCPLPQDSPVLDPTMQTLTYIHTMTA